MFFHNSNPVTLRLKVIRLYVSLLRQVSVPSIWVVTIWGVESSSSFQETVFGALLGDFRILLFVKTSYSLARSRPRGRPRARRSPPCAPWPRRCGTHVTITIVAMRVRCVMVQYRAENAWTSLSQENSTFACDSAFSVQGTIFRHHLLQ